MAVDENNVLHASLSTAFSPTSVPRQSVVQPLQQLKTLESSDLNPPQLSELQTDESSSSSSDDWGREYETQVQTWRAQSAEAREKAEKERIKWERIREAEKAASEQRKAEVKVVHLEGYEGSWENVGQGQASRPTSSVQVQLTNPVDTRDMSSETLHDFSENGPPAASKTTERVASKHERQETNEKWEDIPSLASSFPSTSFPERSSGTSPEPSTQNQHPARDSSIIPAKEPFSATLAIFDSSLPMRARVSALFSSLAINMLLPFVNGVMLGFGEIFAKTVVLGWFGWKSGGLVATNVGLGVPQQRRGPN